MERRRWSVVLAFVVDEEWGGGDTWTPVEHGIDVDYAIISEPTRLQTCVAQKGDVRYEITVSGRSAHSGTPERGVNAIFGINQVLDRLEAHHERLRVATSYPLLAPETTTVTEISGGLAPNVVPDRASVTVDWRLHPGRTDPESLAEELERVIGAVTAAGHRLSVDVERDVFARGPRSLRITNWSVPSKAR